MTGPSSTADGGRAPTVLRLDGTTPTRRAWVATFVRFWPVQVTLARKDFKARYKAASLGIVWSIAMPLIQAAVMAFVFSRAIRDIGGESYAAFVLSGMLGWTYLSTSVNPAVTAIVDGATLTDKVWFPRILLVLSHPLANLPGLVVTYVALVALLPVLGVDMTANLLLLPLAVLLLVTFTMALSSVLGALDVYFRDTKFLVQAMFMVWLYVTPIIYPAELLGRWAGWLDANPMTGIVNLFRLATTGAENWERSLIVSLVTTVVLVVLTVEVHRRHDRRFVDLL